MDQWAIWKWSSGFCIGPNLNFDIGWAEAVAVKLGLRLAIHLNLFDLSDPSHSIFLVHSDDLGVVSVLNKGRSQSREMNRTLKHIFLLQACHHICLHAMHVPGWDNISDALSRETSLVFCEVSHQPMLTYQFPCHHTFRTD